MYGCWEKAATPGSPSTRARRRENELVDGGARAPAHAAQLLAGRDVIAGGAATAAAIGPVLPSPVGDEGHVIEAGAAAVVDADDEFTGRKRFGLRPRVVALIPVCVYPASVAVAEL